MFTAWGASSSHLSRFPLLFSLYFIRSYRKSASTVANEPHRHHHNIEHGNRQIYCQKTPGKREKVELLHAWHRYVQGPRLVIISEGHRHTLYIQVRGNEVSELVISLWSFSSHMSDDIRWIMNPHDDDKPENEGTKEATENKVENWKTPPPRWYR